jgi:hypothetical protein
MGLHYYTEEVFVYLHRCCTAKKEFQTARDANLAVGECANTELRHISTNSKKLDFM